MGAVISMKLPFNHPLHLVIGLTIWAVWFVASYAGISAGCMISSSPQTLGPLSWINISVLIGTLAVSALLLWLGISCWSYSIQKKNDTPQNSLIQRVSAGLYLFSALAVIAVAVFLFRVPPCV